MFLAPKDINGRVDLSHPKWRQDIYIGRVRHFLAIADPRNSFKTSAQLEAASKLVSDYRLSAEPPCTSENTIWSAKHVYDSAYHPESGKKMNLIGRISSQAPLSMLGVAAWSLCSRYVPNAILWQGALQSANAITNYTNRSNAKPVSTSKLFQTYALAIGFASGVGIGINATVKFLPKVIHRFIPSAGILIAHVVNIPLMRQHELKDGIRITNVNGETLGYSINAARHALALTAATRVGLIIPVAIIPPYLISNVESRFSFLKARPKMMLALRIGLVGGLVSLLIPVCCGLFPQICTIKVDKLEPNVQDSILEKRPGMDFVYFNRGL